MYPGYPELFMQLNKKNEFHFDPNWYRGIEYPKEQKEDTISTKTFMYPAISKWISRKVKVSSFLPVFPKYLPDV